MAYLGGTSDAGMECRETEVCQEGRGSTCRVSQVTEEKGPGMGSLTQRQSLGLLEGSRPNAQGWLPLQSAPAQPPLCVSQEAEGYK